MKKLFYIVLIIVILMVIGRLLKKEHNTLNAEPAITTETAVQEEKEAPKIQAVIEEQSVVTEDEDGNMTVDGEVVEDIEEEDPSATANDGETIINE